MTEVLVKKTNFTFLEIERLLQLYRLLMTTFCILEAKDFKQQWGKKSCQKRRRKKYICSLLCLKCNIF